jgi:sodium transport system permease protein
MKEFLIVLKKEFKDIFRDSSTLIVSLIVPALLFPIMLTFLFNYQINVKNISNNLKISIVDSNNEYLKNTDYDAYNFFAYEVLNNFRKANIIQEDNLYDSLNEQRIQLIVVVEKKEITDSFDNYNINLIYNGGNDSYAVYIQSFLELIAKYNNEEVLSRLNFYGLDSQIVTPTILTPYDMKDYFPIKAEGITNKTVQILIPILISAFIALGSGSVSSELFIMEKERHTIESLFTTKAKRRTIFLGKYIVVIIVSLLSSLIQLLSLIGTVIINSNAIGDIGIYFTPLTLLMMILNLFALSILVATLSTFGYVISKSNKSSGAILGIMAIIPTILSFSTTFLDVSKISVIHMLIPVYNTLVATKLALSGLTNITSYLISLGVNILITIVLILLCLKYYYSQKSITFEE